MDNSLPYDLSLDEIKKQLNTFVAYHSVYSKMNRIFTDSAMNYLSQTIQEKCYLDYKNKRIEQIKSSEITDLIITEVDLFIKTNSLKNKVWLDVREKLVENLQEKLPNLHVGFYPKKVQGKNEINQLIREWVIRLYEFLEKNEKHIFKSALESVKIHEKSFDGLREEIFDKFNNLLNVFYHNIETINRALLFVEERLQKNKKNPDANIHKKSINKVADQAYVSIFNKHKTTLESMQIYCWDLYCNEREDFEYNKRKFDDKNKDEEKNKNFLDNINPTHPEPIETNKLDHEITELLKTPENIINTDPFFAFHLIKKYYPLYGLEKYFYLTRISDIYEIKENNVVLDSLSQKSDFGYSEQTRRYFISRAVEKLNLIWEDKYELSKLVRIIKPEIVSYLGKLHSKKFE